MLKGRQPDRHGPGVINLDQVVHFDGFMLLLVVCDGAISYHFKLKRMSCRTVACD